MTRLVLGPLLRHVSAESATIWVETDRPCTVRVRTTRPPAEHTAPTFTVHGHHYALVEVGGLGAGADTAYEVLLESTERGRKEDRPPDGDGDGDGDRDRNADADGDRDGDGDRSAPGGELVWPEPESTFPPSRIRTPGGEGGRRLRIAFGSCRRAPGSDADHGPDALVSYAHRLAATASGTAEGRSGDAGEDRPDALLMIGDQVYADELSDEIKAFIRTRRGPDEEPVNELADFEDYTELYRLAWASDPAIRWLLSTVPTLTIFDDHDIRDDWNTSYAWREQMRATPWWRNRIIGGLGSYWIYQHLGNLPPAERAADPLFAAVRAAGERDGDGDGGDGGELLDAFAEQADREPDTTRWSYAEDFGATRLIVVDSRASRLLTGERRAMLDDTEARWFDEKCTGDFDHLLIASSLPYLLPRSIHHAENWNEAVAGGAWGRRAARFGEKVRQGADLEHWAAFDRSFREVADTVLQVARGERGAAPANIAFLSGDIHYSYLARVTAPHAGSSIHQVVCSPLRNPLLGRFKWANRLACLPGVAALIRPIARLAGVRTPPVKWRITDGPWFDNAIATVEIDGRSAQVRWKSPAIGVAGTSPGTGAGRTMEPTTLVETRRARLSPHAGS